MQTHKTAIEFNCCTGQVSLALERCGYEILGAFDIDGEALAAHQQNFPSVRTFDIDLANEYAPSRLKAICMPKGVDLIWASPPCQSHTLMGHRDPNDPRGAVYIQEMRLAIALEPEAIIFENVSAIAYGHVNSLGRRTLRLSIQLLKEAGYNVIETIQNAKDCGVPQSRERHFIVASKKRLSAPKPAQEPVTVRDAFKDVPTGRWPRTRHSPKVIQRYSTVQPGKKDRVGWHKRLEWDKPSPTLTAGSRHPSSRGGAHTPCRPIHPSENRLITVEEAIRLQCLPDDFILHDSVSLALHFIGEGVPPPLAEKIVKMV